MNKTPRELCLLLDAAARADLRAACERGYIEKRFADWRGYTLLEGLELIERTADLPHRTGRYEPTALGRAAAEFLPSPEDERRTLDYKADLVYSDGTVVAWINLPRHTHAAAYWPVIEAAKSQ